MVALRDCCQLVVVEVVFVTAVLVVVVIVSVLVAVIVVMAVHGFKLTVLLPMAVGVLVIVSDGRCECGYHGQWLKYFLYHWLL